MKEIWYPKNRKKHIRLARISNDKKIRELQNLVNEIKSSKGCKDCGNKDWRVLDFDHIRDKKYGICNMVRLQMKKEKILEEIKKCEVRCANCHRIKTIERRYA